MGCWGLLPFGAAICDLHHWLFVRYSGRCRIVIETHEGILADPVPKRTSAQSFYELPDLDHFLRPAAVPVIAIPLTLRRTASRAVEATNGPAVQSLTWTSPPPADVFCWEKIGTDPPPAGELTAEM
jgi:hypothetical protein